MAEFNDDPILQHFVETGARFSALQGWGSIEKCNCVVRYGDSDYQMPAVRRGKGKNAKFFTPEGHEIQQPSSFEDMKSRAIIKRMRANNEIYIGHIFGPFSP